MLDVNNPGREKAKIVREGLLRGNSCFKNANISESEAYALAEKALRRQTLACIHNGSCSRCGSFVKYGEYCPECGARLVPRQEAIFRITVEAAADVCQKIAKTGKIPEKWNLRETQARQLAARYVTKEAAAKPLRNEMAEYYCPACHEKGVFGKNYCHKCGQRLH